MHPRIVAGRDGIKEGEIKTGVGGIEPPTGPLPTGSSADELHAGRLYRNKLSIIQYLLGRDSSEGAPRKIPKGLPEGPQRAPSSKGSKTEGCR